MTTISTTADLLRLLREDPDFRDEVRRLILSQELIDLPERFARFESYVERRFDSLESSMGQQFSEVRGEITGVRGEIAEVRSATSLGFAATSLGFAATSRRFVATSLGFAATSRRFVATSLGFAAI